MIPTLTISADPALLNHAWVIHALRASYWGGDLTPLQVLRAIDRSLCFGAYVTNPREQVGYCRIVTDGVTFSTVTDLIVGEKWQHQGIGTALMRAALAHPEVAPTICVLQTRDATKFYTRLGFMKTTNVLKLNPT